MTYRITFFSLLTIALLMPCLFAQGQTISPVKRMDIGALELHIQDPLLFVGGYDSVRIYDISDGANPSFLGSFPLSHGGVTGIAVIGNIAIVSTDAQQDNNIYIVDITNRGDPQVLYERRGTDYGSVVYDVHTYGNWIFLCADGGLLTGQLTDVNDLVLVGGITIDEEVYDVVTVGTRAYISTDYTVKILNITDPAAPSIIDSADSNDFNNGLDVEGDVLGVAEGLEGISFYDLSNPDVLSLVTTRRMPLGNEVLAVDLRENYAYGATLIYRSFDVTAPDWEGGLRILDYENINSPRSIYQNEEKDNAYDVAAHNGYVYVAEDATLAIFRHGPLGVRPTSTPVLPTPTKIPTHTPTPTNTPPFLKTATPVGGANTPTATNTPTPAPTNTQPAAAPTNTPVSVPTQAPTEPTNTPVTSSTDLETLFIDEFNDPALPNFTPQLPFSGSFTMGSYFIAPIPTDSAFTGATDGTGLEITVLPGQALTLLGPSLNVGNVPALIRVNARSTGQGAAIALAAIDGSFDGSVATNVPVNSNIFAHSYKRLTMIYKAPSNSFIPLLQVSLDSSVALPVRVYFDNFDVITLPSGSCVPADMLGADGTAP